MKESFYGYGPIRIDKDRFIAAVKRKQHEEEVIMIRNRSKRYTNYPIFKNKYKQMLLLEFKS